MSHRVLAQQESPRFLIGTEYEGGQYVFEPPDKITDCPEETQAILWEELSKTTASPLYVNPKNKNLKIPTNLVLLAEQGWSLMNSKSNKLSLRPFGRALESGGACWVLISSNWQFTALDKKEIGVAVATINSKGNITFIKSRTKRQFSEEFSHLSKNSLEAVLKGNERFKSLIFDFYNKNQVMQNKSDLDNIHFFRTAVGGKNENFMGVGFTNQTLQVNAIVSIDRQSVCRWQASGQSDVHSWEFLGVLTPKNSVTDYWVIREWFYEGWLFSIVEPVIDGNKCEMKIITSTSYNGH